MSNHEEEAGQRLWRHIDAHKRRTEEAYAEPDDPDAPPASEDEELMSLANVVRGFTNRESDPASGQAAARARLIEEIRADQLLRSQPQTARSERRANPAFAWGRTLVLLALLLALLAAVAAGVAVWSARQDHCALQIQQTPLPRAALSKPTPPALETSSVAMRKMIAYRTTRSNPTPPPLLCPLKAGTEQAFTPAHAQTFGFRLGAVSTLD